MPLYTADIWYLTAMYAATYRQYLLFDHSIRPYIPPILGTWLTYYIPLLTLSAQFLHHFNVTRTVFTASDEPPTIMSNAPASAFFSKF